MKNPRNTKVPVTVRNTVSRVFTVENRAVFRFAAFAIVGLTMPVCCLAGSFYNTQVVTQTGSHLFGIKTDVSINDIGQIAFIGEETAGTNSIWFADADGSPARSINPSFSQAGRDFSSPQISNSALIVARDAVLGGSGTYFIRTWDTTGSFTLIANVSNGIFVQSPSLSNDGNVSYVELDTTGSSPSTLINVASPAGGTATPETLLGAVGVKPVCADGGKVVARAGNNPTDPIVLYDPTGPLATISSAPTFVQNGRQPGISDDGNIVVFMGDRGKGPGIFMRVDTGGGFGPPIRLLGESSDPSRAYSDLGVKNDGTPIEFNLDIDSRVAVAATDVSPSTSVARTAIVCFAGTPSLASDDPANPFTAQSGIWTLQVDIEADGSIYPSRFRVVPVAQAGDMLNGQAITGLGISDPIAILRTSSSLGTPSAMIDRANHRVAYWASTAAGSFIMKAEWQQSTLLRVDRLLQFDFPTRGTLLDKSRYDTHPDWGTPPKSAALALPGSIGAKGCAITSLAMALNHTRALGNVDPTSTLGAANFSPFTLNAFMDGPPSRFDPDAVVDYARATKDGSTTSSSAHARLRWNTFVAGSRTGPSTAGAAALQNGLFQDRSPIVVCVEPGETLKNGKKQHFWAHRVLVIGVNQNGFLIADPGHTAPSSLGNPLYNNKFETRGNATYIPGATVNTRFGFGSTASMLADSFTVTLSAHADLLIVDSQGRRAGYDSNTDTTFSEIPDSHVLFEAIADLDSTDPPTEFPIEVWIGSPQESDYSITASGYESGDYTITYESAYPDSSIGFATTTEVAQTGSTQTFSTSSQIPPNSTPTPTPAPTATPTATPTLYVADALDNEVGEFNATTGGAMSTNFISLDAPQSVALSGDKLYVGTTTGEGAGGYAVGAVAEYDAITGAVINANFVSGLNGAPSGLVVSGK